MKTIPLHWNDFVLRLNPNQKMVLAKHKISDQALAATLYDQYQKQGNQAAHDPVAEVVANALTSLPRDDKKRFLELFDVVFGVGVFQSIVQGWSLQA